MWLTWRAAMQEALYGRGGFYTRGECPAAHFRTSVHASPRYAAAVLDLLREVDRSLGHPARLDLVDVGAGRGELLTQVLIMARHLADDPATPALAGRISPHAVDLTPRPAALDAQIRWHRPEPPQITGPPRITGPGRITGPPRITGLVIANEWLDTIPLDVAELAGDGPRLVLVDPATGAERNGPLAGAADQAWLRRWWPLRRVGERAEIGVPRCAAWADVVGRLEAGLALGADYGHVRAHRPAQGTLAGYRDGRPVRPIPDGSRDITAHVAIDACAAAGETMARTAAGETAACAAAGEIVARTAAADSAEGARTLLTSQRAALRALGLRGRRPPVALARADPAGYLAALRQASEEAELTDAGGLGAFSWLLQAVRVPLPAALGCHG
jgi:Putative S-adenosyl-L-methionine-dependent methyltransferase